MFLIFNDSNLSTEPSFGLFCFNRSELKCSGDATIECISKRYQCDGHDNCPKSDDEVGCPTLPPTTATTTTTPLITTIHSITPSEEIKPGIIVLIVIGIIVAIFVVITIYFLYKNRPKPNIIAYSSLDQ